MDAFALSPLRPDQLSPNKPQCVMIVDGHDVYRRGLYALLYDTGSFHVVAEASSCKDALAKLAVIPVDLLLIDINLPDADGIETIEQLRERLLPPHVIILSAQMDEDLLLDIILAGASGYLSKDIPADQIIRTLQGILRGELAMPRSLAATIIRLLVQRCRRTEMELEKYLQNGIKATNASWADPLYRAETSSNLALDKLTPQEYRIFQLLRQGLSNKQIAAQCSISHYTVGKHVQHILHKLGVANRTQAVSYTSFEVQALPYG
jgi:DNA-binding NarL/FixJ family response regulator